MHQCCRHSRSFFAVAGIVLLKNRDIGGGKQRLPLNPLQLNKVWS